MKNFQIICGLLVISAVACTPETADQHDHNHDHPASEVRGLTLSDTSVYALQLTAPDYHPVGDTLLLRGMVEAPPQSRVSIALPYGGQVVSLKYYEGAFVKKGALLAELQHNDYISMQEDFLRLSAEKQQAQAALNRQDDLKDKGSTSEKAYEETRNAYKSVDARLRGVVARMKLAGISPADVERDGIRDKVLVYAPISGYITKVNANIGKYVSANEPVYEMIDNGHLHIELVVFPDQVSSLEVGQSVYFSTKGQGVRMHGTVYLISRDVDADSRAVNVHVHPDEDITGLLPGMFVRGTVYLSHDSIYGLPQIAVAERDGHMVGLAADGEQFELVHFDKNEILPSGIVALPENEKRSFVTGNLQRAVSAYFGGSGNEAGHSH